MELYWIPVAAGASRLRRASLWLWEGIEAGRARRPRATLLHTVLKLAIDGQEACTLELAPVFVGGSGCVLATGPVGFRMAGRSRFFRYQLLQAAGKTLPQERWAMGGPVRLSSDREVARRILELAPAVPPHIWGRRLPGTTEMWTSDSAISWLLVRAGVDLREVGPPPGGRAPGWSAGLDLAALATLDTGTEPCSNAASC